MEVEIHGIIEAQITVIVSPISPGIIFICTSLSLRLLRCTQTAT